MGRNCYSTYFLRTVEFHSLFSLLFPYSFSLISAVDLALLGTQTLLWPWGHLQRGSWEWFLPPVHHYLVWESAHPGRHWVSHDTKNVIMCNTISCRIHKLWRSDFDQKPSGGGRPLSLPSPWILWTTGASGNLTEYGAAMMCLSAAPYAHPCASQSQIFHFIAGEYTR